MELESKSRWMSISVDLDPQFLRSFLAYFFQLSELFQLSEELSVIPHLQNHLIESITPLLSFRHSASQLLEFRIVYGYDEVKYSVSHHPATAPLLSQRGYFPSVNPNGIGLLTLGPRVSQSPQTPITQRAFLGF